MITILATISKTKIAYSKFEKAALELNAAKTELKTKLVNLQMELKVLKDAIEILRNEIIPEAQSAYSIISDGYINGRFTYLDVVDAQNMWFLSREKYVDTLRDYHTIFIEFSCISGLTNQPNFKENNYE